MTIDNNRLAFLSFVDLRETLHESSEIFVKHALNVSNVQFRTQGSQPFTWYGGHSYDHWIINKRKFALENLV